MLRCFLRANTATIFLHRQYSLRPFARHYRHADEHILDMFTDGLEVKEEYRTRLIKDLSEHHKVIARTAQLIFSMQIG